MLSAQRRGLTPELTELLSQAELVLEGSVAEQGTSVRTERGYLETPYALYVDRVIAGQAVNVHDIKVYTAGGTLDGLIESVSHGTTLSTGVEGIFLLTPRTGGGYYLTGGNAGKITRLAHDDDNEAMHWGQLTKYSSWRNLRERIGAAVGTDLSIPVLTADQLRSLTSNKEFCVKLDNPVPDFEEKTVEFDVLAKSSVPGLKFGRAEIIIDYPAGNLGEFIVGQEKIEAEKGEIADGPAYSINVKDETEDQLSLTVESPCDNTEPHYVLDTVYEKIATLTVEVNEWGDLGTMNVNDFAIDGTAEYVNPASVLGTEGCTEFDDLCGEGEFAMKICRIDAVINETPAGGLGHTLTIRGREFGSDPEAEIFIPNADEAITNGRHELVAADYPDIISWSDTEIQVEISSNFQKLAPASDGLSGAFGSGKWRIRPSVGLLGCNEEIDVEYAIFNRFVGFEDQGQKICNYSPPVNSETPPSAQSIKVEVTAGLANELSSANGSSITQAELENIIRNTMLDWSAVSGLDFEIERVNQPSGDLGTFSIASADLAIGTHGKTIRSLLPAGICQDDRVAIDQVTASIQIRQDDKWYFSTSPNGIDGDEYDFRSVLLHEFGHALGFTHSMDGLNNATRDAKVMFHRLNAGDIKRSIDSEHDKAMCVLRGLLESSNSAGCFSDKTPGRALKGGTCTNPTSSLVSPNRKTSISGFYGIDALKLYLNSQAVSSVQIFSVSGSEVYSGGSVALIPNFVSGFYHVYVRTPSAVDRYVLVVHH